MILSDADTAALIPQKPPFVMIGRLLYSDDRVSRSRFLVTADNALVSENVFSEAGLVENMAQTAAARAGYQATQDNQRVMIGYIGAVKNLQVFGLPRVNDVLDTEIIIKNQVFNVTLVTGSVRCADQVLATCEMKFFLTPSI